jgi:type IV secretion system protein VirB10
VEPQKNNSTVPPLREIDAPTGIDLHPDPPETVRVSKLAGLIVLAVLCGIAAIFGYGIYRRTNQAAAASFSKDDSRKVGPATTAAQEITRDIPAAMINLSQEAKEPAKDKPVSATPVHQEQTPQLPNSSPIRHPNSARAISSAPSSVRPEIRQPVQATEQTPGERLLAEAYRRQLQAIGAPTAIRSGISPVSISSPYAPATGIDASGLATLAQALRPSTPANSAGAANSEGNGQADPNMQSQKQRFLAQARTASGGTYVQSARIAPISKYEVKAGWEIPAMLEQELNSDLPGEIKALVTANVYDTGTGEYLLIPQGSRLIGAYDSNIAYGQDSLQVVWHRIIYPDASSIDLGGMIGQDAAGASGFRHDVDHHYSRLIGSTILSSLFSAGFQLSQNRGGTILQTSTPGEIAATAVGQQVSQVGAEITRKNLNIQPTVKIPVGYRFNVRVNRDMLFDGPYTPHKSD